MYFNSVQYGFFFAFVWLVVALLAAPGTDRKGVLRALLTTRNGFLLLASYAFYGFWDWRFLSLIWISTGVDYLVGRALRSTPMEQQRRRKRLLLASLVTNLGLLGFFKYCGFFVESAVDALAVLGLQIDAPSLRIVLPVGISFYTFQTLSYTIDVYRGRMEAVDDPVRFATYVAFFPQLVAGPIERARDLLPQFAKKTQLTAEALHTGFLLICWGLFKKVVIADNVGKLSDAAFGLDEATGLQALVGAWAFAVQIYCDFSGYTDIARGSARCLGFELSLNFDLPYFAQNPSDFWRRWHISLSSWLRDYLYVPLGGNRKGDARTWFNLMATMLLGGLWHGAAWTFVAWGAFHGGILCLYRWLTPKVAEPLDRIRGVPKKLLRAVNALLFFHLVCAGWVLFRARSLGQAIELLGAPFRGLGSWKQVLELGPVHLGIAVTVVLLAVQLAQYFTDDHLFVLKLPAPVRGLLYALGALAFLYLGEFGGSAFIYFQF
jgi:alginate O-acetyltransferase complex protein AlgI